MTETTLAPVKVKHRAMWALGDYPAVATDVIPSLGPALVEACAITAADRVLDVAAGSGNAALPAARTGASVVASDLTPELLDRGRELATAEGLDLAWEVGDAEALPYDDGSFDAVISCVGVMFAPFHQAAADELVRVTRSRWTDRADQLDAGRLHRADVRGDETVRSPAAGRRAAASALGGRGARAVAARRPGRRRGGPQADPEGRLLRDCGGRSGTTSSARTARRSRSTGPSPTTRRRSSALDEALAELGRRHDLGGGAMEWEYLLVTARRT